MSKDDAPPTDAGSNPTATFLLICYFGAVAIAMGGWLWAIGWVIFQTANWLFA